MFKLLKCFCIAIYDFKQKIECRQYLNIYISRGTRAFSAYGAILTGWRGAIDIFAPYMKIPSMSKKLFEIIKMLL